MDAELYHRANQILLEALDLPPGQRAAFLDRCCEHTELRREVETLLAADSQLGDLSHPAIAVLDDTLGPGDVLGSYTLDRELGRGGMGIVYQAHRSDGEFERQVALKVLKRGMDTDAVIRRFRTERQILARLHHPNIAELYEGGTTPDHRPFLVMERVTGRPIDQYCQQHELAITRRIELFLVVCDAVEFAHQNLVVHRDIKPSNILVGEDGVPKLLDFGIAKLLAVEGTEPSTETEAGWTPMTLEYASPEQVEGRAITTASDIYSLGVLLFELLTDRRPYRLESSSTEELKRAILLDEPERPSTAVRDQPGRSADHRRLRGDLDHIVRMTLAKDPRQRYRSVGQLSQDLRSHLEGRPVKARPATLLYRTGRFVRRHRRSVALALVLFVLLFAFAIDRTLQQRETAQERDRAQQVRDFMLDLFELPDQITTENRDAIREVLDHGRLGVEQYHGDPSLQASLRIALGRSYRGLGLLERAEELFEDACAQRRRLRGVRHAEVGECLLLLASIDQDLGRFEAAMDKAQEAHSIFEEVLAAGDERTIDCREMIAVMWMDRGRYAEAEPLMREVWRLKIRYRQNDPESIAQTEGNLGLLLYLQARYVEAEPLLRRAWNVAREKQGAQSGAATAHLNNLAATLRAQGRNAEAEPLNLSLVELRRAQGDPGALATALNNMAMLYFDLHRSEEAVDLLEEALELTVSQRGDNHSRMVSIQTNLAMIHHHLGHRELAEQNGCRALDLALEILGDDHPKTASAKINLAAILLESGQPRAARSLARGGLETYERHLARPTWKAYWGMTIAGTALLELDRGDEAMPLLEEGFEGLLETKGPEALPTRWAGGTLVRQYRAQGRSAHAEELLRSLAVD